MVLNEADAATNGLPDVGRQQGQESIMTIRMNLGGVLKLACAVLLASAIGFSATGASASDCFAIRHDSGTIVIDISKGMRCDAGEGNDAERDRPGVRFLSDLA